jgi:hypothetical protein
VGLVFLLTTTSGLPSDLWDPLTQQRAAPTGTSGGVSLALAIGGLVLFALVGFLIGEWLPARRRRACRIVLAKTGETSQFLVVAGRRVIARSQPFATTDDQAAHSAHDELMARLRAGELEPEPWYEAERLTAPA